MGKKDDKKDDDVKVDDTPTAKPGEVDDEGKYTDEGLDALVKQITTDDDSDKADDKVDDKPDDKAVDKDPEKMVPLSRLNAVIDERNKLRTQVSTVVQPQADALPTVEELRTEFSNKRKEWQDAIFDNDKEKAATLLGEMDSLEIAVDDARQAESESTTRALSADDIRYDSLLADLLKDNPVIKKGTEEFNQEVVTEMFDMREAFIARGYSQTDALEKAAKYVLEPVVDTKVADDVTDTRKADSKRNLADALSRQPADVADVGSPADAINNNKFGIDVTRLKPDQFDKLPDDVKEALRGDKLEEHHLRAQ